jgi:hypothetical protein
MVVASPRRTGTDHSEVVDPAKRVEELIIREARRRHRWRLVARTGIATMVVAGVTVGVVVLVGHRSPGSLSPPFATHPGAPGTAASRCQTAQLQVAPVAGGIGMGQTEEVIGFRNVGKAACTLVGYPSVVALDAEGHPAATAQPTSSGVGGGTTGATAPPTVTLRPGQTASAAIDGESHPTGSATSCPSYPTFLVTPPGGISSVNVPSWSGYAPGPFPGCRPLAVTAVVPGRSGHLPATLSPVRSAVPSVSGSPGATIPAPGASTSTTSTTS